MPVTPISGVAARRGGGSVWREEPAWLWRLHAGGLARIAARPLVIDCAPATEVCRKSEVVAEHAGNEVRTSLEVVRQFDGWNRDLPLRAVVS
jgi:hypothetical protein